MTTAAAPIEVARVLRHLHDNGLVGELDEGAFSTAVAAAFGRALEQLTEGQVLEILWRHYGPGAVIGVAAGARCERDGVLIFKESHDLEGDGEEEAAQRGIVAVMARFGATVPAEDLEDLGDVWTVNKALDKALRQAGRNERAHLRTDRREGITIVLLREQLAPGPLRLCSDAP